MLRLGVLAAVLLAAGCVAKPAAVKRPPGNQWPQRCEMCGSEWTVTPVTNPDEIVPPTVEWCFNDGRYCDKGLELLMSIMKQGETTETRKAWLSHCLGCQGCRCASFDPEEWHKLIGK